MNKHCTGILFSLIFFVLITISSIPLFIIGFNKMHNTMEKHPLQNLWNKTYIQFNVEQILGMLTACIGIIGSVISVYLYITCK